MGRRPGEPAPERLAPAWRRREEHPLRAGSTRGGAAVDHVAELTEDRYRPIDERPADGPDAADVAVRDEGARDIPAVSGPSRRSPSTAHSVSDGSVRAERTIVDLRAHLAEVIRFELL